MPSVLQPRIHINERWDFIDAALKLPVRLEHETLPREGKRGAVFFWEMVAKSFYTAGANAGSSNFFGFSVHHSSPVMIYDHTTYGVRKTKIAGAIRNTDLVREDGTLVRLLMLSSIVSDDTWVAKPLDLDNINRGGLMVRATDETTAATLRLIFRSQFSA